MKTLRTIAAAAFASAFLTASSASASDIAFTGGADGSGRDLSLAANWDGGALPSASGDVGVVDVSVFGGAFTVSSSAALCGLRFENASSAVTLDGAGTLSLGAGGLVVSGAGGITLRAPMAVTAASTWSLGGAVESYAKISGTADLAVNGWSSLHWRTAPGYGGKMTLKGNASRSAINVWQGAAWADTVEVTSGAIVWRFGGRVPFSTIFPGRSLRHTPYADIDFAGGGTLVMNDGDSFSTTTGDFHQIINGGLEIAGGTYTFNALSVMGNDNVGTAGWMQNGSPSLLVSGGAFEGKQFNVGRSAPTNRLVRQTGGTTTMSTYQLGGDEDRTGTVPVAEYRLEGGTVMDKAGAAHDRGLILGGIPSAADNRTSVGIFSQTGGTANFSYVRWGALGGLFHWDDWSQIPNGRAYGLLDIRGGDFLLPSTGLQLATMWNAGSVSNSTYDIRFSGGRIGTRTSLTIPLAMTVERGEGAATWDTGENNVLVAAPVDGEGTLRKTGSGRLQLTDARRFKGSVAVDEGVLEVRGTIAAPEGFTEGQNLFVFSADSLADTLSDGDAVTQWTDSTGSLSCQKPVSGEISSPGSYAVPTFKTNVANGHAALYFNNGHVLGFHPADNPLAGETDFSFAVVFRPTTPGVGSSTGEFYAGRCIIGNDRNWSGSGPNNIALIHTGNNRATLHFRNNAPDVGALGRVYMVPTLYQGYNEGAENLSVAIVSVRGNRVVYNFNNCFTNVTFETVSGNLNPRFMNGNTRYPLYFGTSDVDGNQAQSFRCFGGYIYEARFYKGRGLTEAETRSLMDELSRKYYDSSRADGYLAASSGPVAATFADARAAPAVPAPVAEWTPEFMDSAFGAWDSGYNKPELVPNACNGRSALRFDASRSTVLKVPAGDNQDPLAGKYQFGIAVVFRTTTEGTGHSDATVGTGIYSSMLAGYGHNSGCGNASLSFREYGSVGGYLATNYRNGSLVNSHKPCRLDDGLPHVAVFTGDASGESTGTFRMMVDGVFTENTLGYGVPWPGYDSSRPHVIGALRAGVGHFTGDIMGFSFYHSYLTEAEMLAICRKAAIDYDFNLKERRAFTADEITSRGISATNYSVAAGATLRMPLSSSAPLVVGPGTTFSGDGAFEGSYRFAGGGTADFAGVATAMEDVQVADGGVMAFGAGAVLPVSGANVSAVSGRVVIDVTGSPALASGRTRTLLMSIGADRIAAGTEFAVKGAASGAEVIYDADLGGLALAQQKAFVMIVR